MYIHYMTVGKDIEVVCTPLNTNGCTTVRFEKPSEKWCFKVFECELPSYKIITNEGCTKKEVEEFLRLTRNNATLLMHFASVGGFENA